MNTVLTKKEEMDFIHKAIQNYYDTTPTPHKTLYILYKDYSCLSKKKKLFSQGDLKDIIGSNRPVYGIATTNKQYMQYLKNNNFTLIYTHQKIEE